MGQQALADIDEEVWTKVGALVRTTTDWGHTEGELRQMVGRLAEYPDLVVDPDALERRLRQARRGRGPGPTGLAYEHLQLSLRYLSTWASYVRYAESMVNGQLPDRYYYWLTFVPLVAQRKPNGAIRPRRGPETARRNINSAMLEQF